ncbi:nucleic acid binding protein [Candidatus Scalindua japonica]|uniref:Nucleic acid binding protein n=1 Tax=Candidatus Scalindua japonica TaxID=1284222 RepID=A0A286TZI1_9BACT|nr:S1-like domain-containing RNA-binding protein [Candidatus Scalindua japonica]GAX61305.1 nucleic acid binding protein [Candidatus Scalindua japonica]
MAKIGVFNNLRVVKEVAFGVYLDGGEHEEILLPNRYVPDNCKVGDNIRVFIYLDSEDRFIATTERPYAMVGDFALLKVVAVESVGAFLDWGLPKDLLVPFSEQFPIMEKGKSYIVKIYVDKKSNRIAATTRLDRYLDNIPGNFNAGQEVELLICNQTDIGYKAIINGTHWGVLYSNEVFQTLKSGQKIKGYIKKVRDDNKIDLSLHKPGYEKVDDVTETILTVLKEQGGYIPVTDKSSPETIYKLFGVSKKTYKKAIGAIYKKKLITIENDGIKLISK